MLNSSKHLSHLNCGWSFYIKFIKYSKHIYCISIGFIHNFHESDFTIYLRKMRTWPVRHWPWEISLWRMWSTYPTSWWRCSRVPGGSLKAVWGSVVSKHKFDGHAFFGEPTGLEIVQCPWISRVNLWKSSGKDRIGSSFSVEMDEFSYECMSRKERPTTKHQCICIYIYISLGKMYMRWGSERGPPFLRIPEFLNRINSINPQSTLNQSHIGPRNLTNVP